ncbi:DUF6215 domain-containing protein [Streptomyces sp. NBC_01198]|uniref:DUF6215 domain-containing protein n=1 Tax=Streptomyces sp. NBC_01198 TaxID=2903769 RepID=UPI002E12D3A1|nr:DUF6215 domain-containing protein [Streptomyces sp. NBC_01198]
MADEVPAPAEAPEKETGAWGQAITALVLVGALAGGLWVVGRTQSSAGAPAAATCPDGDSDAASGHASGAQLCEALNRADLAELLGTPGEIAKSASATGSDDSLRLAGGATIATPSTQVEFATYTVNLAASYDRLPVAGSAGVLGDDARQRTVLGRPAVIYSDRTIRLSVQLGGGGSHSDPGVLARALSVARDAKDSGGSFEVTLWRADGGVPDDTVLLRVAQRVLPTIPGWYPDV